MKNEKVKISFWGFSIVVENPSKTTVTIVKIVLIFLTIIVLLSKYC